MFICESYYNFVFTEVAIKQEPMSPKINDTPDIKPTVVPEPIQGMGPDKKKKCCKYSFLFCLLKVDKLIHFLQYYI